MAENDPFFLSVDGYICIECILVYTWLYVQLSSILYLICKLLS